MEDRIDALCRLRGGELSAMSVPTELRGFLKQPIAEGNDLAPRFDTRRRNEPVAGQYRHNVIDRNGKTACCEIVVDQRQSADRDAAPVRRRFQRQLYAADDDLAGGGDVDAAMIAPGFPIFGGSQDLVLDWSRATLIQIPLGFSKFPQGTFAAVRSAKSAEPAGDEKKCTNVPVCCAASEKIRDRDRSRVSRN
jgi:hypothetical protein